MTLLQPNDVPSMDGINDAITSEIFAHADPGDPAGPHYDSGWINLPLRANMVGIEGPRYRRIGKIVSIRGRLYKSDTGFQASTTTPIGDLPVGFRPEGITMYALSGTSVSIVGRFWVDGNGVVNVSSSTNLSANSSGSVSVACTYFEAT